MAMMTSLSAEFWQGQKYAGPEQVEEYVEHSFRAENAVEGVEHRDIEAKLSFIVKEARKAGSVDTINWATFPLPQTFLLEQLHRQRGCTSSLNFIAIETTKLPEFLYRVQLPASATFYSNGILEAQHRLTLLERLLLTQWVKVVLQNHFDWSSSQASPFISLFEHEQSAMEWAQRWARLNRGQSCTVFRIDTAKLETTQVYKAFDLVEKLQIEFLLNARSGIVGQHIALRTIPRLAITHLSTIMAAKI